MKKLKAAVNFVAGKFSAIILFLTLWEISARAKIIDPRFLPPVSKIFASFIKLAAAESVDRPGRFNPALVPNLLASLDRSIKGYIIGISVAVVLGLIIGWFRKFGGFVMPLLDLMRNTPVLALLPVFLMFFGIGELSKVTIIIWGVFWTTLLNTIAGVRNVDPQLVKAARSMGVKPVRLFVTIILPASMPHIFTGMKISATTSILILVAAEMLGAKAGIGQAIEWFNTQNMVPEMFAYIFVMSIIGTLLNVILNAVEKRSFRWKGEANIK